MDLRGLARKQRRLQEWTHFLKEEVQDSSLRVQMADALKLYKNLLAKCWEEGAIHEQDVRNIDDLERKLEQLASEGRLAAR